MARRPTAIERSTQQHQRHHVNPRRDEIHSDLRIYLRPFLKRHSDESLDFFALSTDELRRSDIFRNPDKFSFIQKASLDLLMKGNSLEKKTEQLANFKQLSVFDHASVLVDMSDQHQRALAILVGTNDAALHHAHAIWSWYLARYKQELPIILFGFKLSAGDEHVYQHGFIKPTQLVNYVFKQATDSLSELHRLRQDYKLLDKQHKVKNEELTRLKATAAQPDAASAEQVASLTLELNRLKPQLTELQAQLGDAEQMAAGVEHLQRHVRALEDAQAVSGESQTRLQGWVEHYKGLAEKSQAKLVSIQPEYDRLRSLAHAGPTDPRLTPEERVARFQQRIRGFQQRIRELEGQNQAYARQLGSIGNDLEKVKAKSQTLQLEKEALERQVGNLDHRLNRYERDVEQLHQQLSVKRRSVTELTAQQKELLKQQTKNQHEIKRLSDVHAETLSKLKAVKTERDALKADVEASAAVNPLEKSLEQAQALHVRDEAALANAQAEIEQLRAALDKEQAEQKHEKRMHARAARKLARLAAAGIVIRDSDDEDEDNRPLAKRAEQPRRAAKPASADDRMFSSEDLAAPAVGQRAKPSAKRRYAASPAAAAAAIPMAASASPHSANGAGMFSSQPQAKAAKVCSPYKQLLAQLVETSAGELSINHVLGKLASALDEVTQKNRKIGCHLGSILQELKALSVYFRDLSVPKEAAAQAYEYILSIKFWVSYMLYQADYIAQRTPTNLQDAFIDININTNSLPLPLSLIAADPTSADWTKDMFAIAPSKYGDINMSRKAIVKKCEALGVLPMSALKQLDKSDDFMSWYKSQLKGSTFTKLMWTHLTWRAVSKTDSPNKPAICRALVDLQHQLVTKFNQRLAASSASPSPSLNGEGAAAAAAQPLTFQS